MQGCKITVFADDKSIYHRDSFPSQSLQSGNNNIRKWFPGNKLTVNANEVEMISLGKEKHPAICKNQTSFEYKNLAIT